MFSSIRLTNCLRNKLFPHMPKNVTSKFSTTAPLPHDNAVFSSSSMDCDPSGYSFDEEHPFRVVDVDMETMVDAPEPLAITDINGIPMAPIDIDPWVCEEEAKQGTVDIEAYERERKVTLPPIPKDRNNEFQFKGIKITLPKHMLRPETYRYRLDADDQQKADDIRVCVYDK